MPTEPIDIVTDAKAVQYTGTNSGEIAALIPDFTVTAETPTELTFTSLGVSYTVPVNGFITYWQGAVRETPFANEDDYRDAYRAAAVDHVHVISLTSGPALPPPTGV